MSLRRRKEELTASGVRAYENKEVECLCDNYPFDSDDGILEYFDDTAECPACGAYYCTCCGCDCLNRLYDDYEEDE